MIVFDDLVIFFELKCFYYYKGEVELDVLFVDVLLMGFVWVVCVGIDVIFIIYGVMVLIVF